MILLGEERKVKVVIAIDSFKGCMTSVEANRAAAEGVRDVCPDAEIVQVPVSDGGEGFLEAFHAAIGGELHDVIVRDPLMRPVTARYLLHGDEAVIEIAQASGLTLLTPEERNPMVATSYGTGQLVADAIRRGAKHIIVGLGGSATSDAGIGMLKALIDAFAKNGSFDEIKEIRDVTFTIATDVKNPLCGETGAAYIFAPRKGRHPIWCDNWTNGPGSLLRFLLSISVTTALRWLVLVLQVVWAMPFCNIWVLSAVQE